MIGDLIFILKNGAIVLHNSFNFTDMYVNENPQISHCLDDDGKEVAVHKSEIAFVKQPFRYDGKPLKEGFFPVSWG